MSSPVIGLKFLCHGNGFVAQVHGHSFRRREATAENTSAFPGYWLLVTIYILITRHWMVDSRISIIFIIPEANLKVI